MTKQKDRTTFWVSKNMWNRVNKLKECGESAEDVLDKFIPKVKLKFFGEKRRRR